MKKLLSHPAIGKTCIITNAVLINHESTKDKKKKFYFRFKFMTSMKWFRIELNIFGFTTVETGPYECYLVV